MDHTTSVTELLSLNQSGQVFQIMTRSFTFYKVFWKNNQVHVDLELILTRFTQVTCFCYLISLNIRFQTDGGKKSQLVTHSPSLHTMQKGSGEGWSPGKSSMNSITFSNQTGNILLNTVSERYPWARADNCFLYFMILLFSCSASNTCLFRHSSCKITSKNIQKSTDLIFNMWNT